jgi:hypothetical protein
MVELVGGLVKENVLPEAQTASVGGPEIVPEFKGVMDFEVVSIQPFGRDMLTETIWAIEPVGVIDLVLPVPEIVHPEGKFQT